MSSPSPSDAAARTLIAVAVVVGRADEHLLDAREQGGDIEFEERSIRSSSHFDRVSSNTSAAAFPSR